MHTTIARTLLVAVLLAAGAAVVPASPAGAVTYTGVTARMSVGTGGGQASSDAADEAFLSSDGRYVAFSTKAQFSAADTNSTFDVYVRDRLASTTTLISWNVAGTAAQGFSYACGMNGGGDVIGFVGNGLHYVRDRVAATTEMVSVNSSEQQADAGNSSAVNSCPISDDGRYVAFASAATNLAPGPDNGKVDVFRRDRTNGFTVAVSTTNGTTNGNGDSYDPVMTANGNVIGFVTKADNLVAGDTLGHDDVVARNLSTALNVRISVAGANTQLNGDSVMPDVSADGRYWVFYSEADNAVVDDTNGNTADVFLRDTVALANEVASVTSGEDQVNAVSRDPSVSADGRYVVFEAWGSFSVADSNLEPDTYLRDRTAGVTTLASRRTSSIVAGNGKSTEPKVSDDGSVVAFGSQASDLVRSDTNAKLDVFVRDFSVDHAPFDSFDQLITQGYADMAGRTPTTVERAEAKAKLANGEQSPDTVLMRLVSSSTWSSPRAPVIRLYWAFFLRAPDAGGLVFWMDQYGSGKKTLNQIAAFFAQSNEFKTTYGSLSNQDFVTKIYQNIFERDPDAGGLAFWTDKLDTGAKTRGDVMVNFSESVEGKRFLAPPVNTVLIWLGMLRVVPPKATFDYAVAIMKVGGEPPEFVVRAARTSPGYAARV